jgi:hypothetical protein
MYLNTLSRITLFEPHILLKLMFAFIFWRSLFHILEGKRPLGRPRCKWEDNIKMDFQEVGGVREDWMELAQDRDRWRALVGTVRDFRFP